MLPLLIELRSYADPKWTAFGQFLDSLHTADGLGLPRQVLEHYLARGGGAMVEPDGLDEVFDPARRDQIAREISGFAARYPHVRIVITSRPIGYRRQVLDDAGFALYQLQDSTRPRSGPSPRPGTPSRAPTTPLRPPG